MNEEHTTSAPIRCHERAPFAGVNGPTRWLPPDGDRPYRHCSYCGSIHPDDLKEALEHGHTLTGADHKYGWPHKFYSHGPVHFKWYNVHFLDMTKEEFALYGPLVSQHSGIEWFWDDEQGVGYRLPYPGYQKYM